jgi:hypothetical protein
MWSAAGTATDHTITGSPKASARVFFLLNGRITAAQIDSSAVTKRLSILRLVVRPPSGGGMP